MLLWAVGVNRNIGKSLLLLQRHRICCRKANCKDGYFGKDLGEKVKRVYTLPSEKKPTGNLEIYCCSFPYLTTLFSDIPLYLNCILSWMNEKKFLSVFSCFLAGSYQS